VISHIDIFIIVFSSLWLYATFFICKEHNPMVKWLAFFGCHPTNLASNPTQFNKKKYVLVFFFLWAVTQRFSFDSILYSQVMGSWNPNKPDSEQPLKIEIEIVDQEPAIHWQMYFWSDSMWQKIKFYTQNPCKFDKNHKNSIRTYMNLVIT
jgi:hypothetical protein